MKQLPVTTNVGQGFIVGQPQTSLANVRLVRKHLWVTNAQAYGIKAEITTVNKLLCRPIRKWNQSSFLVEENWRRMSERMTKDDWWTKTIFFKKLISILEKTKTFEENSVQVSML